MNKAFYITGIVLSFVFLIVCGYYASAVSMAKFTDLFTSYNPYGNSGYSFSSGLVSSLTSEAAMISLFFFVFFLAADLLGVIRVKTRTMKVMGIIGMSLAVLFLIWDLAVLGSPGSLSFDEVGTGFMFYALIAMAFSIVGLIQSIRFSSNRHPARANSTSDLLDS